MLETTRLIVVRLQGVIVMIDHAHRGTSGRATRLSGRVCSKHINFHKLFQRLSGRRKQTAGVAPAVFLFDADYVQTCVPLIARMTW